MGITIAVPLPERVEESVISPGWFTSVRDGAEREAPDLPTIAAHIRNGDITGSTLLRRTPDEPWRQAQTGALSWAGAALMCVAHIRNRFLESSSYRFAPPV